MRSTAPRYLSRIIRATWTRSCCSKRCPSSVKRNLYFGAAADRWFVKGKKKLVLQPWYQSMVLGNFPIVRGGGAKSLGHARWLLEQGCNVCIFPEGTRTMKDELGRFKPGVAILALELGVPVVPVYLSGLREMRPKGALHAKPGPAGVDVFMPVRFAADTSVDDATAALRAILAHVTPRNALRSPRAKPRDRSNTPRRLAADASDRARYHGDRS